MPIYIHGCEKCSHEWEDLFKLSDPIPDKCPQCNKKNCIKRLIPPSIGGVVVLTGREHVQKLWDDGKKIARDAKTSKSENMMANLQGEDNFNKMKLREEKLKKEKF